MKTTTWFYRTGVWSHSTRGAAYNVMNGFSTLENCIRNSIFLKVDFARLWWKMQNSKKKHNLEFLETRGNVISAKYRFITACSVQLITLWMGFDSWEEVYAAVYYYIFFSFGFTFFKTLFCFFIYLYNSFCFFLCSQTLMLV